MLLNSKKLVMVHTFKYFFGTIPVGILGTQIIPGALVWQHCLAKSGFAKLPNNKRVWQHYLTKIVYDRPLASPLSDYNMYTCSTLSQESKF